MAEIKAEQIPREVRAAMCREAGWTGAPQEIVAQWIVAALNAWPGMALRRDWGSWGGPGHKPIAEAIILPLPTEASDDQ